MKKNQITLADINVDTCNVKLLVWAYLNYMNVRFVTGMTVEFNHTKMLCCETGLELIAVYGFKGNFDSVYAQMNSMLEKIEQTEPSEDLRSIIINNLSTHRAYQSGEDEFVRTNPHFAEFKKAQQSSKPRDEVFAIFDRYLALNKHMHDAKQCVCYCN